MLLEQISSEIRKSYIGGAINMFILYNSDNELVYTCDINLLYLSVIKDKFYSIDKPTYFKENIRKYNSDAFSFSIVK